MVACRGGAQRRARPAQENTGTTPAGSSSSQPKSTNYGQLVHEDGGQGVAPRGRQPAVRDLPVRLEHRLELAIEVLDGVGAELVVHPAHLHARIGMGIWT